MTHFILQILCVGCKAPSNSLTMKRLVKLHRNFSTSNNLLGWRDKFVFEDDWNKRPSDVEIRKKGLPQNTPTLEQRIKRDSGSSFMEQYKKGGYFKGPTGSLRDYIDPEQTTKEMAVEGFKELKIQLRKWKDELKEESYEKIPDFGELRTEWSFDSEEK